ncbi:hypothetical protein [Chitinophaga flava]|uniref:Uncharacterized protein n=1 Tax=Chitinophaga flava TaxID=2259036 RepID=A0A365XVJ3_9BACT|nr:hypothetical protein [Chitinophaga flava]RBL90180.1 hypothetical protein DF182_27315 [Chitinophaga flava]
MQDLLYINDENDNTCLESFLHIAETLMNRHLLKVRDHYYRIVDCEFYYNSRIHNDPYALTHEQSGNCGEWNFHGSGMDITLTSQHASGGIMIQGIASVANGHEVPSKDSATSGPLKVCSEIFQHVGSVWADTPLHFGLVPVEQSIGRGVIEATIFSVPRIGLNITKDNHGNFSKRPYRFLTFLHLPHKEGEKIRKYLTLEAEEAISPVAYQAYNTGRKW